MKSRSESRSPAGGSHSPSGPYYGSMLERHQARCGICRHPRREQIEQDFLDWSSPRELAETYRIPDFRAIYRHANAFGLFDRRRSNIQRATDRIIERVADVDVNAEAVIAAIRITLNEERKWLDCVHRLIHEDMRGEPPSTPAQTAARAMPERYFAGLAPRQPEPPSEPQAPGKSAPAELEAENPPEEPRPTPEKSAAPPASKPARPVEVEAPSDPNNAPGQVAGIPWPWPAKKIRFSRRRPWRPSRPGG